MHTSAIKLLLIFKFITGFVLCFSVFAEKNPDTFSPEGSMYIGVDYYPEHWPKERWETDIQLMKEAGFNVVRLAEFSWILLEPFEGKYEFEWLDEAIDLLGKNQIKVVLGTPTAVMPAWVARKYPETLATQENGNRIRWGARKNNCFSNGTYRLLSERITQAMAEHYNNNPNIIGWQTDNEFSGPNCFCERCLASFQDWLKNKYNSLNNLNKSWGTHFWGHTIKTWQEIEFPDCSGEGDWEISGNPSACLDWKRFHSWLNVRFQADQIHILRERCPNHFITHNFMGLHRNINYYDLAKDLDFVSWDNYPVWGKPGIPYSASMAADVMRGLKAKNFWIMEQTAGPTGWGIFYRNPRPGEIRKICYQQLAHGADAQIWFRWRTCTAGREQYWHGLLGHDGKALRRYNEASQVALDYQKLETYLSGTTVIPDVAIFYDYETIWSVENQPGFLGNDVQNAISRYYNALFRAGVNVNMIHPETDFSKYKLILVPDQVILPDQVASRLDEFVKNGGVLLADCRTAVKDENNLCHERTLPGLLSPALGIIIEEYSTISDFEYPLINKSDFSENFTASRYVDWIKPLSAKSIVGYKQWHLTSFAAVTRNEYGKGKGWYVGTVVKEESFYDDLIERLLKDAEINPVVNPPLGVEVSIRRGNNKELLFLVNHTEEIQRVVVPPGKKELLTDTRTKNIIELNAYEVTVVEL